MSSASAPNDGVVNNKGLYGPAFFTPIFLAAIPVSSFLSRPGGLVEKAVNGLVSTAVFAGTAGASTTVSAGRVIPTLGAVYAFTCYAFGGALSASGIEAGCSTGRDNSAPRAQIAALSGLPLRMHSAASHLQETFPAWGFAAALSLAIAPTNQHIINLLGLAALSKMFLFVPSYLANLGTPRTLAHVIFTGSVVSVAWKLARGAA